MEEFYMDVVGVVENEDGSATVTMKLNEPAKMFFIQQGFNAIMKEAVKNTLEGSDNEKGTCCGASCSNVGCKS